VSSPFVRVGGIPKRFLDIGEWSRSFFFEKLPERNLLTPPYLSCSKIHRYFCICVQPFFAAAAVAFAFFCRAAFFISWAFAM
jgi:hypothetical protein